MVGSVLPATNELVVHTEQFRVPKLAKIILLLLRGFTSGRLNVATGNCRLCEGVFTFHPRFLSHETECFSRKSDSCKRYQQQQNSIETGCSFINWTAVVHRLPTEDSDIRFGSKVEIGIFDPAN